MQKLKLFKWISRLKGWFRPKRQLLFKKFNPISDKAAPAVPKREVVYQYRAIFSDTTFLHEIQFRRMVIALQFRMEGNGVQRYLYGEPTEQLNWYEYIKVRKAKGEKER